MTGAADEGDVDVVDVVVSRSKRRTGRSLAAAAGAAPDADGRAVKAVEVARRVAARYGEPAWSDESPLGMLVEIILSHRTRDAQTARGYASLRQAFPTWEAMRDAPLTVVEDAIANVHWHEAKAARLQALMRRITEDRGELSLGFLADLPAEDGRAWLRHLDGVGPKTAACVLLFALRKPILPVDTHVHRVSARLGLIDQGVSAEAAHLLLRALLPPDARTIYNYHAGLLAHGQQVCVPARPRCEACVLNDLCGYYHAHHDLPAGRATPPSVAGSTTR